MIICKRATPDNNNKNWGDGGEVTRVTGGGHQGDRGDGTERGDEGKGEGGEEILAHRHADGPIKGSTRGPCEPKKQMFQQQG